MKKEKLVISLILMIVMIMAFSLNVLASNDPQPVTPLKTSSNVVTPQVSQGTNQALTPSANNSVTVGGEAGASANQTRNNTTLTPTNGSTSSSYRNTAAASTEDLPYTGSSYKVVFVIIALVVSAVYAYKKVSDYNM